MSVPTAAGAALWLDAFLGDGSAGPSELRIALLTADPREGGAEIAGDGYARVTVANTDAVWGAVTDGAKRAQAVFPAPTGDWETARWWAAAPDASADWCLAGALSSAVTLADGDTPVTVDCNVTIDREF